ncbi:hypothetical protein CARUB_v10009896mg [Capsella rubella]|uniref:MATH domain-containing protein n=1 Tax=Capsella rubella TaxID=81985 RepID=R0IF98_9BRAS|nr:MATH domain and coiled-coil domain-containing protein At2g42460 [Capsella rubella]EOA36960.1 hypothetical protein CARUB_v10009896mg [Capsella rubella]
MGTELKKSFSWEIDNFSDINKVIRSGLYSSGGGCQWFLQLYPKGYGVSDHVSLALSAYKPESLRLGWKRKINLFFVFLNQSGKELCRSNDECRDLLFCAEVPRWIFLRTLPLTKLQQKGFLKNNKLTIKFNIEVTKVVHQGKSTKNDIFEFNGVHILVSQAVSKAKICRNHPGFFNDFYPKTKEVNAVYFTLFFSLIETLSKSPRSLSVTELRNAQNQLTVLTKAGFKLDFLKSKLNKASSGCQVQNLLGEQIKNVKLTLSKEKIKYAAAAKVSSFGFIGFFFKKFFLPCFSSV